MNFLIKFIKNIKQNKNFTLKKLDESKSIFFQDYFLKSMGLLIGILMLMKLQILSMLLATHTGCNNFL